MMATGVRQNKSRKFLPLLLAILFLVILYDLVIFIRYAGYGFSYQGSTSMPKGLYFIQPAKVLQRNDTVIFYPPAATLAFLKTKGWSAPSGLLMKEVMAVPGDYICKHDRSVWINHHRIAPVYREYAPGKTLPSKPFCEILANNNYLLMSTHIKRSFDGRYFGAINEELIVAKATKVF